MSNIHKFMTSIPKEDLQKAIIFTDGAAFKNPTGPGGYGVVVKILDKDGKKIESIEEFTDAYPVTSNSKMELMGVIAAIENLNKPTYAKIYSDSAYVVNAFRHKWIEKWIDNKWKKQDGSPVQNLYLWLRLLSAMKNHYVEFYKVEGHTGVQDNERCDFLSKASASGCVFEKVNGILNVVPNLKREDMRLYNSTDSYDGVEFKIDQSCYRIIVAGSRTFTDYTTLSKTLDNLLSTLDGIRSVEIISGTADGADTLGERYASEHNIKCIRMPAKWDVYGKSAGFMRNQDMCTYASLGIGLLCAFWDGKSKGTEHMINIAHNAHIDTYIILYNDNVEIKDINS